MPLHISNNIRHIILVFLTIAGSSTGSYLAQHSSAELILGTPVQANGELHVVLVHVYKSDLHLDSTCLAI